MEPVAVEFDFYMEHPAIKALSARDVNAWREKYCIDCSDPRAPKPVRTFLEAAFPEYVTAECEASGFNAPTPIQSQAWPIALKGLDVIGLANTGSGKTLGFVLPAIVHVMAQDYLQAGDGPIVLVVAPTRELALQIKVECDKFGASSGIKNVCVYGGVPKGPQVLLGSHLPPPPPTPFSLSHTLSRPHALPLPSAHKPLVSRCVPLAPRPAAGRRDCDRDARAAARLSRRGADQPAAHDLPGARRGRPHA